jgi:hypothetical protein
MKKILLLVICFFSIKSAYSQAPYLGTAGADGLGQYGYLEKDAVTFTRLFRNTYENIAYLSARYWITDNNSSNGNGKEFIYHVYAGPDWINGIGWQCGGDNDGSKRTTDFIANDFNPEWSAGSDCYVSVCAKYCDNSYSPASFDGNTTNGAIGFNERHFKVIDVDTSLHISTSVDVTNISGTCIANNPLNVVGSFTITPGTTTGLSLQSLYLKNIGTSIESTDIPNDALKVFYEPATGTEIFNGSETFAGTLLGNWDANTTDNVYGSSSLNIPLNGKVRVYVLLCNYNNPSAVGKNINLTIINDGINITPALDGFTKLRINSGSISQRFVTLPIQYLTFKGERSNDDVKLYWMANSNQALQKFIVQQSFDGVQFTTVKDARVDQFVKQQGSYLYQFNTQATFFRLITLNVAGEQKISPIINLKRQKVSPTLLVTNPIINTISIQSTNSSINTQIALYDVAGKILYNKTLNLLQGTNTITLPSNIPSQVVCLQIVLRDGTKQVFKLFKQ